MGYGAFYVICPKASSQCVTPLNLGYFPVFHITYWYLNLYDVANLPYWIQFIAHNLVAIKHIILLCRKFSIETENGILETEVPSRYSSDKSSISRTFNSFFETPCHSSHAKLYSFFILYSLTKPQILVVKKTVSNLFNVA